MQFGKPVFLSRCTSLPEVGGDFATYFDQLEPEPMNRVFNEAMAVPLSDKRSAEIREHARSFTWERAAREYLALYRKCIELDRTR